MTMRFLHVCCWLALAALSLAASPRAAAVTLAYPAPCISSLYAAYAPETTPTWRGEVGVVKLLYGQIYPDTAYVLLWRVGCNPTQSALLLRIGDFEPIYSGMLFPTIRAFQGSNTDRPVYVSDGEQPGFAENWTNRVQELGGANYVLERAQGIDFNQPLTLMISGPDASKSLQVNLPAYEPTPATYPEAYQSLPLVGYIAGNYYDPAKPGEGILVDVVDVPPSGETPARKYLQFVWFTFDTAGNPFWITGGEFIDPASRRLDLPAVYRTGGGFGGAQSAQHQFDWGRVAVEFTDCSTLQLDYASAGTHAANVPTGSGHRTWKRLTTTSGHACN